MFALAANDRQCRVSLDLTPQRAALEGDDRSGGEGRERSGGAYSVIVICPTVVTLERQGRASEYPALVLFSMPSNVLNANGRKARQGIA